ncbi:hypothetical protein VSDG_04773 [Cytospora chrysosperma]|uniref:F-box domain-containing protein n=1 Tax=Cytospora chrysosperma TaxID=252740 RepID=A0A423W1T2_CYTCH|nr:hypothetical protein VSDG_04773 [Valsa sordida]
MAAAMMCSFALAFVALTALSRSYIRPKEDHRDSRESHGGSQQLQQDTQAKLELSTFQPVGHLPFLKLPPEVRNMIYQLILVDIGHERRPFRPRLPSFRQPALTQVNRQIRTETLSMFYTYNMFTLRVPSPDHSPDLDHSREEQQWMRFVRGLKLFSTCGYLPIVSHLTIEYLDHDAYKDQDSATFGTGRGMVMMIEFFRTGPKEPDYEETARKMGMSVDRVKLYWQLNMGVRVGNDETEWDDCDAVDKALATAIDDFTRTLRHRDHRRAAETVGQMTVGRLVEALHALLSGQDER